MACAYDLNVMKNFKPDDSDVSSVSGSCDSGKKYEFNRSRIVPPFLSLIIK